MMKYTSILFIILFFPYWLSSQSRSDLEKERNKIIQQIEQTTNNLKKNQSSKSATLKDLSAIENQIKNRKQLISNIQSQIKESDRQISKNTGALDSLAQKLATIKGHYNEVIRINYLKDLSESKWSYIFSAASLNDAFLRWRYSKQFESYVNKKSIEVNELSGNIVNKNTEILEEKTYISTLLQDEKENFKQLEKDQKKKDEILKKLKKKESALKASLAKQKKDREKLNAEIENIIIAELSKREKESSETKAIKKTLSSTIQKNMVNWPVDNGYITSRFGNQPHPTIKNLTITNNGVDIASSSKQVQAVADGSVIGVTTIPGYDYMIIIQHGEYYSVYSKLKSVSVSKDQNIKAGNPIGSLGSSGDELHFELWQNKKKLNPQDWLKKK